MTSGKNGNHQSASNENNNVSQQEAAELSVEDYELISAGLIALGEAFAFLSLLKARQLTKDSGGESEVPKLFTLSTKHSKKNSKRKRR